MGSISSDQDEAQRSTPGSCSSVPDGFCAVLYDDENCAGWSFDVPTGTYDLPSFYRNDAEVVVVKRGCKLTGMSDDMSNTNLQPTFMAFPQRPRPSNYPVSI